MGWIFNLLKKFSKSKALPSLSDIKLNYTEIIGSNIDIFGEGYQPVVEVDTSKTFLEEYRLVLLVYNYVYGRKRNGKLDVILDGSRKSKQLLATIETLD